MRVVAGAIAGGAAVGVVLGLTVFAPADPVPASLSGVAVPVYACPGADEVGTLHRGDRVLVTGRSGDWLAVRNVRGAFERVFVAAASVVPDADLSGLPEVGCDDTATIVVAVTSTTVLAEDTTTTVPPGDTSTTTSTTAATTTTTLAAPSVGSPSADPDPIWEKFPGFPNTCPGDGITTVAAAVSAPAGIQSVTLSWTSAAGNGSTPMTLSGGLHRGDIGPFDATGPAVPQDGAIVVSATVTVIDSLGRSASSPIAVTVNDCTFG